MMRRKSSRHRACDDFHRTSEATRRRFLEAPLTRRQVIGGGLGAGLAIYAAKAMSLATILEAATARAQSAPGAPVLVTVYLPGGCDLLDTLVPLGNYGRYADLHPGIKQSPAPLGSTGLGVHPALREGTGGGVGGLFEQGKVGFIPGIDYANPDLSHFHSRHFWESGIVTNAASTGWLGRWLDANGSGDNPLQGLSMTYMLSPALKSAGAPVASVSTPDDAQLWIPGVWDEGFDRAMEAWAELAAAGDSRPGPVAAQANARMIKDVADRLKPYTIKDEVDPLAPPVPYPENSDLGKSLRYLAGLIAQPLGIRVATVEALGDFDTHDKQQEELTRVLTDTSLALAAFQADLESRGVADRVLTFVWSEFGRRPEQNQSGGTDHGAGGIAWVQGSRARAGILSDYPDLNRFDGLGNLAVTTDFRRVYASLIEQWLGTDAGAVIPQAGAFGRIQVVA